MSNPYYNNICTNYIPQNRFQPKKRNKNVTNKNLKTEKSAKKYLDLTISKYIKKLQFQGKNHDRSHFAEVIQVCNLNLVVTFGHFISYFVLKFYTVICHHENYYVINFYGNWLTRKKESNQIHNFVYTGGFQVFLGYVHEELNVMKNWAYSFFLNR